MHSPRYIRSRCAARDGLALILVLAFILLLSILVVSYLTFSGLNHTSTASYSRAIQAQEIAQGGLQDILSDLHTEIQAGSSINPSVYAPNGGPVVYVPVNNLAAVPARAGYDLSSWGTDYNTNASTRFVDFLSPSLVRVSRRSQNATPADFYPNFRTNAYFDASTIANLSNRASASSTATPSANGRYITAARWNRSYLLAPTTDTNTGGAFGVRAIPGAFAKDYTSIGGTSLANGSLPPYGPPDWIYVTRNGSRALTTAQIPNSLPSNNLTNLTSGTGSAQGSPVIGRYAFVMYDEGALLDANVAGYTGASTNLVSTADPVTGITQSTLVKSYTAYADLTQIGLTQAFVDSMVSYRNASSNPTSGNSYLTNVLGTYAKNGFLAFTNNATGIDSPFVSRQDLINYLAQKDPNFNTASALTALPHLGTFTRDANSPSYFPPTDSAGITNYFAGSTQTNSYYGSATSYGYHTSMDTAGYPNRDLANVRFPSSITTGATVTHYDDNAVAQTYTVNPGDCLLQSRFSLAKINWLTQPWAGQPDPGTDNAGYTGSKYPAAIQACFGLVWDYPSHVSGTQANGGSKCWNYVGSTTAVSDASSLLSMTGIQIETLDQVAAEGREPNFFEMLKAAILNGSLGKSTGISGWNNGQISNPGKPAGVYTHDSGTGAGVDANTPPYAESGSCNLFSYSYDGHGPGTTPTAFAPYQYTDCQIIQIGANMIDQFDADSYPTAIYFKYGGEGSFDSVNKGDTSYGTPNCPLYGPVNIFAGDENLPELFMLLETGCSTNAVSAGQANDTSDWWTAPGGGTKTYSSFMQPALWNPHQQPATPLFKSTGQKYQMRAYGAMTFQWSVSGAPTSWLPLKSASQVATQPMMWFHGNSNSETNPDGTIFFTDASNTSSFYGQPFLLTSDGIPSTNAPMVSIPRGTGPGQTASANIAGPTFPYYKVLPDFHFVAFHITDSFPTNSLDGTERQFFCSTNDAPSMTTYIIPYNQCGTGSQPLNCNAYSLGWVDSNNVYHPYSFMPGVFSYELSKHQNGPSGINDTRIGAVSSRAGGIMTKSEKSYGFDTIDCRTTRFPQIFDDPADSHLTPGDTFDAKPQYSTTTHRSVRAMNGFPYNPYNKANGPGYGFYGNTPPTATNQIVFPDYQVNAIWSAPVQGTTEGTGLWPHAFYSDPDGVVRPGDGFYSSYVTGDGRQLFVDPSGNGVPTPTTGKFAAGDKGGNVSHGRRPVILNRPFRSVGELSYTFRDLPFKTLDFFSQSSADAALLDVFTITDEASVSNKKLNATVAGHVNLSNAPVPVLNALLNSGAKKEDFDLTYYMTTEVPTISKNISTMVNPTNAPPLGPLLNRANLVTALMPGVPLAATNAPGATSIVGSFTTSPDLRNKAYFEAPVRALASVTNTRTWNLLIDVIAQSGRLAPGATSLDNFVVEGEKRYWLHVAIDRYTGRIIDQQLEPVYE